MDNHKIRFKFKDTKKELFNTSDFYVSDWGRIIEVSEDEDYDGDLVSFVEIRDDLEVIIE